MANKILAKDKLDGFIAKLGQGAEAFAPQKDGNKTTWQTVSAAADVDFDFVNTDMSPKDFFFPQTECMMHFKNDPSAEDGMIFQAEDVIATPKSILNMRPCDAKAFQILDMIFVQDEMTDDLYWRLKREQSLICGLACNEPCPTCFCSSVNCGPHHEVGQDLQLVDLGDKFLVKVLSEKGESKVDDLPDAAEADEAKAAELKAAAEETIVSKVSTDKIDSKEILELYEDEMWDRVFEGCLNCGTCTFVCPTCHCFDIQDEVQGDYGRRVRNWDYCMSWLFTMHGTGHNPRGTKKSRVRQRFMHKFKYIPVKRDGEIGCVGCGRCIQMCPVNIDVRQVVDQMNA